MSFVGGNRLVRNTSSANGCEGLGPHQQFEVSISQGCLRMATHACATSFDTFCRQTAHLALLAGLGCLACAGGDHYEVVEDGAMDFEMVEECEDLQACTFGAASGGGGVPAPASAAGDACQTHADPPAEGERHADVPTSCPTDAQAGVAGDACAEVAERLELCEMRLNELDERGVVFCGVVPSFPIPYRKTEPLPAALPGTLPRPPDPPVDFGRHLPQCAASGAFPVASRGVWLQRPLV